MRMMTEAVETRPMFKACTFLSPSMDGKRVGQYNKTALVYLMRFEYKGVVYAKVGFTRDIMGRMKKHVKELPGCQLCALFPIASAEAMELEFKEQYSMHRVHVNVDGKIKTELFIGLELSEFEAGLLEIQQTFLNRVEGSRDQTLESFNRALAMIETGKLAGDSKCFEVLLEMVKQKQQQSPRV